MQLQYYTSLLLGDQPSSFSQAPSACGVHCSTESLVPSSFSLLQYFDVSMGLDLYKAMSMSFTLLIHLIHHVMSCMARVEDFVL